MANWKHRLDLSSFWKDYHNGKKTIEEMGARVAEEIRETLYPQYEDDLDEIVDALEYASCVEDFDYAMNELYDWADQEIPPYGKWPRNKMCWVKTVG